MREIVSTTRTAHLTVLGVLEKVPDESKPAIQQVISDSEERLETFAVTNSTTTSGAQRKLNIKEVPIPPHKESIFGGSRLQTPVRINYYCFQRQTGKNLESL